MKVLLEYGLSGHAARDCRLGWFRNGSDGAILLLLRLLLRSGLKRPETIVCGDIAVVVPSLSGQGSRRTHLDGVGGTTMARRVPLPLISIHANIEHSMKLLCDWRKEKNEETKRWECVVKGSCEPEERRNSVDKVGKV